MMKMNKMKMLKFQMANQEKLKRKRDEERIRRKERIKAKQHRLKSQIKIIITLFLRDKNSRLLSSPRGHRTR
tara:strand:+ start:817 stop:1032 length:216 start_codon:yes stop_codon:yes gene_type:complete